MSSHNTASVRNWWMVCLTRSSINSRKTNTWPTNVDKNMFYQNYLDTCVGTPVAQARFWRDMSKWSPWTDSTFPMGTSFTLRSLTDCRNQFNSNRDWANNNVFAPRFSLNMTPTSLNDWWGETLVTGRWSNQTVDKTKLYLDYVRFATTEGLPVARRPRFWRFLHHTRSKTGETWNTVSFGDLETLRKTNNTAYVNMLTQYNTAFGECTTN